MIKAWTFRDPSRQAVLSATGSTSLTLLAGLGLGALVLLGVYEPSRGTGAVLFITLFPVVLVLVAAALVPWLSDSRSPASAILLLGREDLATKLGADLLRGRGHRGDPDQTVALGATWQDGGAPKAINLEPDQLKRLVREQEISRIVVLEADLESREAFAEALLECRLLGVRVEDGIDLYQRLHGKMWLEALDPARLAFANGFRITPGYRFAKRVLDIVCAFVLLIVTAPLAAVIALAIKLDSPGPVLFRQERVGQFGKTFTLLKFRSMRLDAEEDGPAWASKNDDRATRVGRFLRKSHLDEIPQAINVLRGDLSFVGPRPERPCFVEMLRRKIPYFDLRLYVKPGITGWAQVRAPYADSVEDSYEKLEHDLYYARMVSPLLDLEILFRTVLVMITGKGR